MSPVVYQPLLSGMVKDAANCLRGDIYLNPGATPVPLPATTGKSADEDGGSQVHGSTGFPI